MKCLVIWMFFFSSNKFSEVFGILFFSTLLYSSLVFEKIWIISQHICIKNGKQHHHQEAKCTVQFFILEIFPTIHIFEVKVILHKAKKVIRKHSHYGEIWCRLIFKDVATPCTRCENWKKLLSWFFLARFHEINLLVCIVLA